jgi:hypothetical protein
MFGGMMSVGVDFLLEVGLELLGLELAPAGCA